MKNKKNVLNKNQINSSKTFIAIFIILFGAIALFAFMGPKQMPSLPGVPQQARPLELSFSDVIRRADDIKTMNIHGNDATGTLSDGTKFTSTIAYDPELLTKLASSGATISIDASKSIGERAMTGISVLLALLFIWWLLRGMKGGGIGRALTQQNPTKITTGKTKTTFKDVAGIDSEKQELMEIVDFLKNRDKFKGIGARVPRGVLLSGQPGTGKTLLARAIAGEANVPFFAASGSDFSGIIVGLGVAKIKEIFEMAKRNAPCILFIDEIDAIGQRRSQHS